MDQISKYRITGAMLWLGLLVLIVPKWYSEPVNFVPNGEVKAESKSTLPLVEHAYRLPVSNEVPLTNEQEHHKQQVAKSDTANTAEESDKQSHSKQKTTNLYPDKVTGISSYSGQWIVRIRALENVNEANALAESIDKNYPVYIKYYEKTKMYSVRTGPYLSEAKAKQDRAKLDKMLHTKGEVVQLP
jgi:cell division septation protein DedD